MSRFIDKLRTNPRRADLGMAGPGDVGNQKTMTQSFCHRTHFDIFGTYYPRSLQVWRRLLLRESGLYVCV